MPLVTPTSGGLGIEIPITSDSKQFTDSVDRVNKKLKELEGLAKENAQLSSKIGTAQEQSAKKATMSWTDFRSMYQTVLDVVRVGQQVWAATIGISQQYADQVRNLSAISGQSAQETSKYIQVLDDYNISAEDAVIATKALTKEGYAPTIETLAMLSDKYNALSSVQEKNAFVLKNLGKGGLQWIEVLKKGGAAIRAQGADINSSLVLNQKQLEASKALFLELDNLKDASTGLGTAIGNYLTPAMQVLVHTMTGSSNSLAEWFAQLAESRTISIETSRILKEQGLITKEGTTATKEQIEAARVQAEINIKVQKSVEGETGAEDENKKALDEKKAAVESATAALDDYKKMLDGVSQANQDAESFIQSYADFSKGYAKDHAQAAAELSKAVAGGNKEDIAQAQKGIQELEATWHEATQGMIYDMVLAKVSIDGLTDAEFKATQDIAVQMGIRTQAQADEAKAAMDKANSIVDGIAMQEDVMREKMQTDANLLQLENDKKAAADGTTAAIVEGATVGTAALDGMTASLNGNITAMNALGYSASLTSSIIAKMGVGYGVKGGMQGPAAPKPSAPPKPRRYALGGEFMIPMQYGNEGFNMGGMATASGGEKVTITPKGQAAGGTVYNIYITNPKREAAEDSIKSALRNLVYTGSAN